MANSGAMAKGLLINYVEHPPSPEKFLVQTLKMRKNWDEAMDPSCNHLIPEVRGHHGLHRLCLMVTTCCASRPVGWSVDAGRECGTLPMLAIRLQSDRWPELGRMGITVLDMSSYRGVLSGTR